MTTTTDRREDIVAVLSGFESRSLPDAARDFFATLGYQSDRRLPIATVQQFCEQLDPNGRLTPRAQETLGRLQSLHFLFQLTDAELSAQAELFDSIDAVDNARMHSYLFFAAELPRGTYPRSFLSSVARAINKPLPMPALILFRHGDRITLAIIHRRLNKRQGERDVLEKATLIKDVRFADPLRAHVEILNDLVFSNLNEFSPIHSFVTLHQAWQKRLDTYSLNDRFYQEIADWYFWAMHLIADGKLVPPASVNNEPERSLFLIRMLTRLIFCWFLQDKRLLPSDLFREHRLSVLLKDFNPNPEIHSPDIAPTYYRAILQNLFFATLNQPPQDDHGKPIRGFRRRTPNRRYDPDRGATNLWHYEDYFTDPDEWVRLTAAVPFLNGGLFDCLDRKFQKVENRDNVLLDGFSDNPNESVVVPNDLFFGPDRTVDLSVDYGEEGKRTARSKRANVRGLIHILSRYKFTMEENTPLDQEIALDPELLGKVFENLLASYNPETRDTARKQTGSFYTPREVVAFMVDEALIAYLEPILGGDDPAIRLRALFAAAEEAHDFGFGDTEVSCLVEALDSVKILDPACGSGAFPMGALHRLVDLLRKLDPENKRWEMQQRARLDDEKDRAQQLMDPKLQREALEDIKRREEESASLFDVGRFDPDYTRKLFLIENAIFGSDIQPVATQIAKLRVFVALICDQKIDPQAPNQGVLPLPNLETRIVAANTLMPIPEQTADGYVASLFDSEVREYRARLQEIRHEHFAARHPDTKRRCRERDAVLRKELSELLQREKHLDEGVARLLANWDPYDQNSSAQFFDPAWMFGDAYLHGTREGEAGFDIVIGNPPYVRQEKIKDQKNDLKPHYPDTFAGTADLYVYFYDRALQLLRPGGILSYITSNKWYRAAYGEKLRTHLGRTTTLVHAIDFGDADVFTAIAYPTIIIARKAVPAPKHVFRALNWDPTTSNTEIAKFADLHAAKASPVIQSSLSPKGWRFIGHKEQDLLGKISAAGTPLGEFVHRRFYRGVLTGLNEAFVVDRATRDRLIAEDPKSEEMLKPFLRGRDVKRWHVDYQDLWLILIKSSENKRHPWTGREEQEAEELFKSTYPALHAHFAPLRDRLVKRYDQGKYFWELRSCGYYDSFLGPKVIYPDIYEHQSFAFDDLGFFATNTTYFIPHETKARFLTTVLNSKAVEWFYGQISNRIRGGYLRAFSDYMRQIPIPAAVASAVSQLEAIHDLVTHVSMNCSQRSGSRDSLMRDYYEQILNALVYELYLPEDLHAAGLRFFEQLAATKLPEISASPTDAAAQLADLRRKFEELYAPSHPLRASIQKLHTLESIRIIEGKA